MVSNTGGRLPDRLARLLLILSMKKLRVLVLLASAWVIFLSGCASQGPSPEQQAREADEQRHAEQQQAEFRKSLPPVTNPGRGQ